MGDLDFAPTPTLPAAARPLLDAFRLVFGADRVGLAGFAIFGDDAWWFLRHTVDGTRYDLGPLLASEALRAALPAVAGRVNPDRLSCFAPLSPLLLAGHIAQILTAGGPDHCRVAVHAARGAAHDFVDAVLGDRHADMTVLHSRTGWSRWFHGDVWDRTWAVVDHPRNRVWLLCVTAPSPPSALYAPRRAAVD